MRCNPERGAALLEAVVALAVLSVGGATAIALAIEAATVVTRTQEHEAELRAASRLLEAVVLWPREDFDRHFGTHWQGQWLLTVERPAPAIYVLTLSDKKSRTVLLQTAVFRPLRVDQ